MPRYNPVGLYSGNMIPSKEGEYIKITHEVEKALEIFKRFEQGSCRPEELSNAIDVIVKEACPSDIHDDHNNIPDAI